MSRKKDLYYSCIQIWGKNEFTKSRDFREKLQRTL